MDNKQNIQERWIDICQEYLKLFCDKHEYSFEDCFWVADNYGTIVNVSDMFISMEPHLDIAGQFGGSTSPDKYRMAVESVKKMLNELNISWE